MKRPLKKKTDMDEFGKRVTRCMVHKFNIPEKMELKRIEIIKADINFDFLFHL
jgi:hypothetical protein